jgi:hypothetical protein
MESKRAKLVPADEIEEFEENNTQTPRGSLDSWLQGGNASAVYAAAATNRRGAARNAHAVAPLAVNVMLRELGMSAMPLEARRVQTPLHEWKQRRGRGSPKSLHHSMVLPLAGPRRLRAGHCEVFSSRRRFICEFAHAATARVGDSCLSCHAATALSGEGSSRSTRTIAVTREHSSLDPSLTVFATGTPGKVAQLGTWDLETLFPGDRPAYASAMGRSARLMCSDDNLLLWGSVSAALPVVDMREAGPTLLCQVHSGGGYLHKEMWMPQEFGSGMCFLSAFGDGQVTLWDLRCGTTTPCAARPQWTARARKERVTFVTMESLPRLAAPTVLSDAAKSAKRRVQPVGSQSAAHGSAPVKFGIQALGSATSGLVMRPMGPRATSSAAESSLAAKKRPREATSFVDQLRRTALSEYVSFAQEPVPVPVPDRCVGLCCLPLGGQPLLALTRATGVISLFDLRNFSHDAFSFMASPRHIGSIGCNEPIASAINRHAADSNIPPPAVPTRKSPAILHAEACAERPGSIVLAYQDSTVAWLDLGTSACGAAWVTHGPRTNPLQRFTLGATPALNCAVACGGDVVALQLANGTTRLVGRVSTSGMESTDGSIAMSCISRDFDGDSPSELCCTGRRQRGSILALPHSDTDPIRQITFSGASEAHGGV